VALSLDEVSQTLWRERQLLDLLVCKLEVEQLVLAANRTRCLPAVTREVEYVLAEVKQVELMRAVLIDGVAGQLGLQSGCTLRELAEAAPSPWDGILEQHRIAFLSTAEELRAFARINRDLLSQGARAVQDALAWLCESGERPAADSYSPVGASTGAAVGAGFVDGRL
jgi:FlgN protein